MAAVRRFLLRLANLLRPGRAEPDLARELDAHLTLVADDLERRGMTPEDARLAARRTLGGIGARERISIATPARLPGSTTSARTWCMRRACCAAARASPPSRS